MYGRPNEYLENVSCVPKTKVRVARGLHAQFGLLTGIVCTSTLMLLLNQARVVWESLFVIPRSCARWFAEYLSQEQAPSPNTEGQVALYMGCLPLQQLGAPLACVVRYGVPTPFYSLTTMQPWALGALIKSASASPQVLDLFMKLRPWPQ